MFKVLVVEDDFDLNRTVSSFLNQHGYEATDCKSAEKAYDAMYNTVFDPIVADLISNILKLNKLKNQQIFPEVKVYNLGEQLCECLLNFENIWESEVGKGSTFAVRIRRVKNEAV